MATPDTNGRSLATMLRHPFESADLLFHSRMTLDSVPPFTPKLARDIVEHLHQAGFDGAVFTYPDDIDDAANENPLQRVQIVIANPNVLPSTQFENTDDYVKKTRVAEVMQRMLETIEPVASAYVVPHVDHDYPQAMGAKGNEALAYPGVRLFPNTRRGKRAHEISVTLVDKSTLDGMRKNVYGLTTAPTSGNFYFMFALSGISIEQINAYRASQAK